MNEIEAISVLETRIKYPNSDTYGGMCEAEYQQEAVVLAIDALREQAEREKGCGYCTGDVDDRPYLDGKEVYIGGKNTLETPADGKRIYYCPMCGKRLEVEHDG